MKTTLKEIKKGEFFTLKDYGDNPPETAVYIRRGYDREEKKYECEKFCDFNHVSYLKGSRTVYIGFTF